MLVDDPPLAVCRECWNGARCATCELPLAGPLAGDGTHCTRCVDAAPRCAACGRPIFGAYRRVRGEEGDYCVSCAEESRACAICGVPVRDPVVNGGRTICPDCSRGAMTDVKEITRIYRETHGRLGSLLGLHLRRVPELHIVTLDEVDRSRLDDPHALEKLGGLYTRDADGKARIHLVTPVTEPRARAVFAHELAHAWQTEACPDDQGKLLREGFAEWVAWKIIEGQPGAAKERAKIEARTDEYGRGFRNFRGIEERQGTEKAIWYARSTRGGPRRRGGAAPVTSRGRRRESSRVPLRGRTRGPRRLRFPRKSGPVPA